MEQNKNKFQPDKRIFTICIYTIITTTICTIIIRSIWNWEATTKLFSGFISIISPFLIGFLIAYIMGNISNGVEKHFFTNVLHIKNIKLKKGLSLISSYLIVIAVITGALFFIIPAFLESIADMAKSITELYNKLIELINSFSERYPNPTVQYIQELILENQDQYITSFTKWATGFAKGFAPSIATASMSVIRWILNLIVAIIVSIYMLLDKDILVGNLERIIHSIFSPKRADYVWDTITKANDIFSGFIIGKTIDSTIIGILCLIFMKLLGLGGSYTVIISIFVGITNMIPYFGPFIGAIPSIIIIFLAVSPQQALIFSILILAIQQFDGNVLGPYILGDKTGLRPIWIIFAITIGGWLGGVIGMFLGVPCVAVIAYILNDIMNRRLLANGYITEETLSSKDTTEENPKLTKLIKQRIKRLKTPRK